MEHSEHPMDQPMNRRFPSAEEAAASLARIETATDLVKDAARVAGEIGPRDRDPGKAPETVPSVSAILVATALIELAAAIRQAASKLDHSETT